MSDLIDRKAAIDVIDKIFPADPMHNEYTKGITCGAALAKEFIKQLPSAEPKTAVWVGEGDGYVDGEIILDTWYCSNCDYCPVDDEKPNWNYCPNCGAKMEVEE